MYFLLFQYPYHKDGKIKIYVWMVRGFYHLKYLQRAWVARIALSQPEVIKCMQELLAQILCPLLWKQLDELITVPLAFKTWVEEFVMRDYHPTYGSFTCGLLTLWELEKNKTETESSCRKIGRICCFLCLLLSQMEIKPNPVKRYKLHQSCPSLHGVICGYLLLMYQANLDWLSSDTGRENGGGGTKIMPLNHNTCSIF